MTKNFIIFVLTVTVFLNGLFFWDKNAQLQQLQKTLNIHIKDKVELHAKLRTCKIFLDCYMPETAPGKQRLKTTLSTESNKQ